MTDTNETIVTGRKVTTGPIFRLVDRNQTISIAKANGATRVIEKEHQIEISAAIGEFAFYTHKGWRFVCHFRTEAAAENFAALHRAYRKRWSLDEAHNQPGYCEG